jgi:hypothetical protein
MKPPLHTIVIIPLNDATLCPEMDCRAVSNQTRCPICSSETLPLHRITERQAEDEEKNGR